MDTIRRELIFVREKEHKMILQCTCIHPYQDKLYGKGKRVHNQMQRSGGGAIKYRCTVCKTERESGSANIALPKKEG